MTPQVSIILTENDNCILESDISKTAAGAALFQCQQGQRVLIGYYSKKSPQEVKVWYYRDRTNRFSLQPTCNQILKHHCFEVLTDYMVIEKL